MKRGHLQSRSKRPYMIAVCHTDTSIQLLDEYTIMDIVEDLGECVPGMAYVKDTKDSRWRRWTKQDDEAAT